jgi:predicted small lipoprotein YifL
MRYVAALLVLAFLAACGQSGPLRPADPTEDQFIAANPIAP